MIFSYIFLGLVSFSPMTPAVDSLQHSPILSIVMDSLEMLPLPALPDFKHGNSPVDITFEMSLLNLETRILTIKGMVVDHNDVVELPGVRLVIGRLDSTSTDTPIFTPRVSVLTNHRGIFTLSTKITKSDILIVVWLGYLEKAYSFKNIAP
jgi:hypothetical protein